VIVATVEAIGILKWPNDGIRVLSLGCTTKALNMDWSRRHSIGKLDWAEKIADVFLAGQSSGAIGMAQHLVADRQNIVRISPFVGDRYELDSREDIPSLKGLGAPEARKALRLCGRFSSRSRQQRRSSHTTLDESEWVTTPAHDSNKKTRPIHRLRQRHS